ncbi:MAG: deferrochelatase/peroxidase EfeB, partial [Gammaproteobacteria bacterium]|nr:deferrochelatase/peroxidase EfeB [Gammaproteobacteria bacterium]
MPARSTRPAPKLPRRHPVSVAVSLALLGAATLAGRALAAETAAAADAAQDVPPTPAA